MRTYNETRRHILKDKYLKRHYGIGLPDYERMYEAQGGTCAICGGPETAVGKHGIFLLAVDHNEETGAIRQLLCMNHNRGLGFFNHDPALLRAAIAYLESHAVTG